MSSQFSVSESHSNSSPQINLHPWPALLEQATKEVFEMMLGCEIESAGNSGSSDEPGLDPSFQAPVIEVLFQREAPERDGESEVTAVIGLAGELCGVLNFACGLRGARIMASKMLGVEESAVGEQQWDAIGEICNMVAGNFKSKLPGIGERCMLSVPTIVVGSNYRLRAVARRQQVRFNFRVCGAGARILLEVQ